MPPRACLYAVSACLHVSRLSSLRSVRAQERVERVKEQQRLKESVRRDMEKAAAEAQAKAKAQASE